MTESVQSADLRIETERVEDIPLVVAQMRRMELPEVLDSRMVVPGNRQGLSSGWTVVVWLAHVRSEADHRLSQGRPGAARGGQGRHSGGRHCGPAPGRNGGRKT